MCTTDVKMLYFLNQQEDKGSLGNAEPDVCNVEFHCSDFV